tara:strand:+ start:36 stop:1505 length:1470 start_codon:yes stop_codon:yes gene_type:complete
MSQFKGNTTNFKPSYAVAGETSTPINVIPTSLEVQGQMVEGYQSTYANGTSKWTPYVLTDTALFDSHDLDRSTFTGSKNADGEWVWEPTHTFSVRQLSQNYRGPTGERITESEIEDAFYNKNGITQQQQLSVTQTLVLEAEYGEENLATVNNGQFANLAANSEVNQDTTNAVEDAFSGQLTNTFNSSAELKKVRTQYGDYRYPLDLASNKQDRIIFRMKLSTGRIIDPNNVDVNANKRKSSVIQGSVTLPITSGISDVNSVSWGGETMNPIQAFAAKGAMETIDAAGDEQKDAFAVAGRNLQDAAGTVTNNPGVQRAISTMIAGKAAQTKKLLSRAAGAIDNPNLELLFDAPALRAFQFSFQMSPRDPKEAGQVRSIINFFKQGMSVKTTSTNVFLKAPNYFEIEYTSFNDNGEMMEHPSLNRIKTCALLSCGVDYTPNGQYMTYSDPNRSMVSYTMNLQFSELDPIYESDYYDELGMQNGTNVQKIGY